MSVLVKGMEMPKSCFECPFMLHRCFCLVNPRIEFTDEEYSELKGRYSGCPLVPVPPHGRLIDADAVIDLVMQYCPDDDGVCSKAGADLRELLDEIENLPTVIPAEEGET